MIKVIAIILILSFCSGCASIQYAEPWYKAVGEISRKPYILGVYDCMDKAQEHKDEFGGVILNVSLRSGNHHAVNDYIDRHGNRYILDCTSGKVYLTANIDRTVWMHLGGKIVSYDYVE